MSAQLSMPSEDSQPIKQACRRLFTIYCVALLSIGVALPSHGSPLDRQIVELSAIDRQFMDEQRSRVEALANRLGRRLSGSPERDLDTLQVIIDRRWIEPEDQLTQQAMGVVFGDLLAKDLGFNWVVYRDRAGRNRALRYRQEDIFIFPMTMLSRRISAGAELNVTDLYNTQLQKQRARIPGGRWLLD
jgi:hypothetical protein